MSSIGESSPGPLPEKKVVRVLHFYDTEFGYGAKDHTNVLKQRLAIGVVSWVEFEDGTRQETLAKFEMVINDWEALREVILRFLQRLCTALSTEPLMLIQYEYLHTTRWILQEKCFFRRLKWPCAAGCWPF